MNAAEAYVEMMLSRLLASPHYAAATDAELAEMIVVGSPKWIKWPLVEQRILTQQVAARRGSRSIAGPPSGTDWDMFVGKFREAKGDSISSPTKLAVANAMGWADEDSLGSWLEAKLRIKWRAAKRFAESAQG